MNETSVPLISTDRSIKLIQIKSNYGFLSIYRLINSSRFLSIDYPGSKNKHYMYICERDGYKTWTTGPWTTPTDLTPNF